MPDFESLDWEHFYSLYYSAMNLTVQDWESLVKETYPDALPGHIYRISQDQKKLQICEPEFGKVETEILLPNQKARPEPIWGNAWGHSAWSLSREKGIPESILSSDQTRGLLIAPDFCALADQFWSFQPVLCQTPSSYWPYTERNKKLTGPHDLYFVAGKGFLIVSDRRRGCFSVLDLENLKWLAEFQIRKTDSDLCLNFAADAAGNQVFITDNESSLLYQLSLDTLQLHKFQPGLGILGNLMLDPSDPRFLFLVSLKPERSLVYFDIQNNEVIRRIALKGRLFSRESDVPTELLSLGNTQSLLTLLEFSFDPVPYTPLLEVIDTQKVKVIRRYTGEAGKLPFGLGSALKNPYFRDPVNLIQTMERRGLLSDEKKPELPEVSTQNAMDLRYRAFSLSGSLDPDAAPRIVLPAEADAEILDILAGGIFQQTGIHIHDYPKEVKHLSSLIPELRVQLETRWEAFLDLKILNRYALRISILREALLQLLELRDGIENGISETPPDLCPFCASPLLGSWNCPVCGFELLSPARFFARFHSSAEPQTWLLPGQVLICLTSQKLVLVLDHHQKILLKLEAEISDWKPISAVALPNGNYLVLDGFSKYLQELNPAGDLIWTSNRQQIALKDPQWLSFYLDEDQKTLIYLIADQGRHQVFACDSRGSLRWSYGTQGVSGQLPGYLNQPRFVQRTAELSWLITDSGNRRIIELNGQKEVIAQWAEAEGLIEPVWALRVNSGETWIVDRARRALLIFKNSDSEPHIAWEGLSVLNFQSLESITRHANGNLVLSDSERCIEIDTLNGGVCWERIFEQTEATQLLPQSTHSVNPLYVRIELLQSLRYFADVETLALIALARMLEPITVAAGEWVFQEGDLGDALYLIESGAFQARVDQNRQLLAEFSAGDVFGEMALIFGQKRSSSIQAIRPGKLLRLRMADFQKISLADPELMSRIQNLAYERQKRRQNFENEQSYLAIESMKRRIALSRMRNLRLLEDADDAFFHALQPQFSSLAFKKGQFIFRQGDPGNALFFVNRGEVEILDAKGQLLTILPEGVVLGEMALLNDRPRSASARCLTYTEVFRLEKEMFFDLLKKFPEFEKKLRKVISERKEEALDRAQSRPVQTIKTSADPQLSWLGVLSSQNCFWQLESGVLRVYPMEEDPLELLMPASIVRTLSGSLLLADTGHDRILELEPEHFKLIAEYGDDHLKLSFPRAATRLSDGSTLIADTGQNRILHLTEKKTEVIRLEKVPMEIVALVPFETGFLCVDSLMGRILHFDFKGRLLGLLQDINGEMLSLPRALQVLPNHRWLIAEAGRDRIIEVNAQGDLFWSYSGSPDAPLMSPDACSCFENGQILIVSAKQTELRCINRHGELLWVQSLAPSALGAEIA